MKNMHTHAALALIAVLGIASAVALSTGGGDKAPQSIVDGNMVISQQNAEKNAVTFKNARFPDAVRVLIDSDGSISPECRFGDGWASGTLEMKDGTKVAIKCETAGSGKGFSGCLTKDDFVTKSYAGEEGHCNDDLTQLPKFK